MSLSKFLEMVEDREAWPVQSRESQRVRHDLATEQQQPSPGPTRELPPGMTGLFCPPDTEGRERQGVTAWKPVAEKESVWGRLPSPLLLTVSPLCSYYPLYPPQEDMAIDYENFYLYAQLPVTPDVFIAPSELRYFVKVGLNSAISQQCQNQFLSGALALNSSRVCWWGQWPRSFGGGVGVENKSVSIMLK